MTAIYHSQTRHPGESNQDLTSVEISKLGWSPTESFALVNINSKSIVIGADNRAFLYKCLDRMTDKHTLWGKLRVVSKEN